jgi:hypothetical protein
MTLIKVQDSHAAIVECCECGEDIQKSEYRSVLTCGHRHIGCRPAKASVVKVALNKLFNWVVK